MKKPRKKPALPADEQEQHGRMKKTAEGYDVHTAARIKRGRDGKDIPSDFKRIASIYKVRMPGKGGDRWRNSADMKEHKSPEEAAKHLIGAKERRSRRGEA